MLHREDVTVAETEFDLTIPQPFMKPFPEPEEVFAGDYQRAAKLLAPCVSVDLHAIDPQLEGWIHLVTPIEPLDSYVGDGTEEYHNYYCRPNWIGFRLNDDNKYEFLADWRYFLAESDDPKVAHNPELIQYYKDQAAAHQALKQAFHEHHKLLRTKYSNPSEVIFDTEGEAFIDEFGGAAGAGNWAMEDEFPLEFEETDDDCFAYPLTEDGRRFRFIAGAPGYSYQYRGADFVLLFFDPETRIALFTFDWS